ERSMYLQPDTIKALYESVFASNGVFFPELILCAGIVAMLLMRVFAAASRTHMGWMALVIAVAALVVCGLQWHGGAGFLSPTQFRESTGSRDVYAGLLVYDHFMLFLRLFLFGFAALVVWLSLVTGIPDREDAADFYTLLLGAILGMALMASANH